MYYLSPLVSRPEKEIRLDTFSYIQIKTFICKDDMFSACFTQPECECHSVMRTNRIIVLRYLWQPHANGTSQPKAEPHKMGSTPSMLCPTTRQRLFAARKLHYLSQQYTDPLITISQSATTSQYDAFFFVNCIILFDTVILN